MTGASRNGGVDSLPTWGKSGTLNVLVDTPRGSAVKFKLDRESGVYTVAHFLTPGAVFPFDFGSIPSTSAEDGDPLDLLVLAEAPTFPGCLVPVRLVGGLEARQTQEGKTMRNDRLLGVASESRCVRVRSATCATSRSACSTRSSISSCPTTKRAAAGFASFAASGPEAAKRLVKASQRRFESERGGT